jgi:hypothetical protein
VREIARVDLLLANSITQVLIPRILAGYKDNVLERGFPCLPLDLSMRPSWMARVAVPTEIETPA